LRKLAVILVFLAPGALYADEVFLKDAGSISGRVVEQNETTVKVDIGDGFIAVPASRVERIEKGRSALDEYADRAAKLGPQDVEGWKTLARWASKQGYPGQAREAANKVLAIAPNDPDARKALGFVMLDGKWVTLEESYRAKGYVKFDGEWMTPAEAQAGQAALTAERAQRDADYRANAAENAKVQEDTRAEKNAERERYAKEKADQLNPPVYWGGWGYGATTWPTVGTDGFWSDK
jgi:tetratricopeptide repeat protein